MDEKENGGRRFEEFGFLYFTNCRKDMDCRSWIQGSGPAVGPLSSGTSSSRRRERFEEMSDGYKYFKDKTEEIQQIQLLQQNKQVGLL